MKTNIKLLNWRRKYKGYRVLRLVRFLTTDKKENMESWLSENCSSDWNIYLSTYTGSYCAFESETDAMAFKLRWI